MVTPSKTESSIINSWSELTNTCVITNNVCSLRNIDIPEKGNHSFVFKTTNNITNSANNIHTLEFIDSIIPTFPKNIFNVMPKVDKITMRHVELTEITRSDLENADNLIDLDLSHNKISEITSMTFSDMNLSQINLSYNLITHLNEKTFVNMEELSILILRGNKITSIHADTFSGSNYLLTIDLSENNIKVFPTKFMQGLVNSNTIFLDNNKIEEIPNDAFSNMEYLKYMSLKSNMIHKFDAPKLLSHSVETLFLDNNLLEHIDIPFHIKNLHISNNKFKKIEILQNNSLEILDVSSNPLENVDSLPVENLNKITELHLSNLEIKSFQLDKLQELENLKVLNLSQNELNNLSITNTTELSISLLDVDNNNFENISELRLTNFPKLEELRISYNFWKCDDLSNIWDALLKLNITVLIEKPYEGKSNYNKIICLKDSNEKNGQGVDGSENNVGLIIVIVMIIVLVICLIGALAYFKNRKRSFVPVGQSIPM